MLACRRDLLLKMAELPPDPEEMLADVALVEALERVNATAVATDAALREGAAQDACLDATREVYRPVAREGAMLYFLLAQLGDRFLQLGELCFFPLAVPLLRLRLVRVHAPLLPGRRGGCFVRARARRV